MSAPAPATYDDLLAEYRRIREAIDHLADRMTLLVPRPAAVTLPRVPPVWSCGHAHASRDEASACVQEQRRAAAAPPPPALPAG